MNRLVIALAIVVAAMGGYLYKYTHPMKYFPREKMRFISSGAVLFHCYKCEKGTTLYKLDEKDRVICDECYLKEANE